MHIWGFVLLWVRAEKLVNDVRRGWGRMTKKQEKRRNDRENLCNDVWEETGRRMRPQRRSLRNKYHIDASYPQHISISTALIAFLIIKIQNLIPHIERKTAITCDNFKITCFHIMCLVGTRICITTRFSADICTSLSFFTRSILLCMVSTNILQCPFPRAWCGNDRTLPTKPLKPFGILSRKLFNLLFMTDYPLLILKIIHI